MATIDPSNPGFYTNGKAIPRGKPGYVAPADRASASTDPLGVGGIQTVTGSVGADNKGYYKKHGTPIGVPKGYTSPPTRFANTGFGDVVLPNGQTVTMPAHYFEGDQFGIAGQYKPDQLGNIQDYLIQAGLMTGSEKTYARTSWGPESAAAMKKLMAIANAEGVSWQIALGERLQAAGQAPKPQPVRPPLQIRLTNPQDLADTFQKTALSLYGSYLPQDQVNNFVNQFHQQETQAQTQAYNTQGYTAGGQAFGGGTATDAETPQVAATNYIKTNFPGQVAGTAVGENFDTWNKALTSSMPGGESQASH